MKVSSTLKHEGARRRQGRPKLAAGDSRTEAFEIVKYLHENIRDDVEIKGVASEKPS